MLLTSRVLWVALRRVLYGGNGGGTTEAQLFWTEKAQSAPSWTTYVDLGSRAAEDVISPDQLRIVPITGASTAQADAQRLQTWLPNREDFLDVKQELMWMSVSLNTPLLKARAVRRELRAAEEDRAAAALPVSREEAKPPVRSKPHHQDPTDVHGHEGEAASPSDPSVYEQKTAYRRPVAQAVQRPSAKAVHSSPFKL